MAQEVSTLNNPNFCSVIQVDKDISFVLDNRDLNFALSVPTQKHIGMSRRTYSKKHPITYNPTMTLLESKVNGDSNGSPRSRKSTLKNSPKCTSSTPPQKTKEIRRKRPLDSDLSKTPIPRKMRKRETTKMLPSTRINGRITGRYSRSSLNVPSSDPDIQIIQVIEHRGTSTAFKRDSNNSFSGKERSKEKINDIHKKRNAKSLPSMIKLCYPSNDDVPITEADIAPVIPSNSVIPDTSVSEANQDVIESPNKWMISTEIANASSVQIVETQGAKETEMKYADKSNLFESEMKVPQCQRRTGKRELKNLYANLNEIRWAKEKDFKQMLNRHSERITAKNPALGKNLRNATSGKPVSLNKQRKVLAKKNSAKLVLNRAKYGRLKPKYSRLKPKYGRLKPKLVLKKNVKTKPSINKVSTKPLVKPNKKLKLDPEVKTKQPKVGVKPKVATGLKPNCEDVKSCELVKSSKIAGNSSKYKLASSSQGMGKSVLPSALKKSVKAEHDARVISKSSADSKVVKKFEYSNEVKILGKSFSDSKVYTTAMKKGSKLRVHVEPLEHTNLWNTDFCEAFSKYVIEQSSSQMETKNKESIKVMFEELMESWYTNPAENAKIPKKKKPEEETLRSSVRQSEGAFRYKEIVVKKHENYMQFILVPNAIKQNSLSIEAMKELKDAFLLAKKDPNCRAVLLNSSGTFFCTGIDLSLLVGSNKKQLAEEMASTIKELVLTLSTFTKPVVAAVNGTAVGFGVTLLTLCDVVLASDKATFCIPATRLGYLPEGGITLTLPQVVGSTVATELLLYGRRLTADQALRHGLVSEVLWHSNLMNEVVPRVQVIVSQPLQVMEATKTMVRCQLWDRLKFHMEREWRLLPPLWLDAQCQSNIKKALQTGWLID